MVTYLPEPVWNRVKVGKSYIPQKKAYNPLFESRFETGGKFAMRGSTVLVKVVLFQLRGHGHPQDRAMPNFFPDSKSSILGLSNEVSFVTEYFWKDGENQENIFPL